MKKAILFISIIMLAFVSMGQVRNIDTGYDGVIKNGNSAYFFKGTAADTTGVLDSLTTKTVFINTNDESICDIYVDVDSIDGTGSVANAHYFIVRYKEFPDDPWTNIDTVTYTGTADTTFTITSTSAKKARYWQLLEKGKTDEFHTELQKAYFNLWF